MEIFTELSLVEGTGEDGNFLPKYWDTGEFGSDLTGKFVVGSKISPREGLLSADIIYMIKLIVFLMCLHKKVENQH